MFNLGHEGSGGTACPFAAILLALGRQAHGPWLRREWRGFRAEFPVHTPPPRLNLGHMHRALRLVIDFVVVLKREKEMLKGVLSAVILAAKRFSSCRDAHHTYVGAWPADLMKRVEIFECGPVALRCFLRGVRVSRPHSPRRKEALTTTTKKKKN
jgi:hypothetical protein